MKTSFAAAAFALVAAAYSAVNAQSSCDTSAIKGMLYANATEMMANCEVDVFALNDFPTQDEIDTVVENTDCVNYINQVFQVANVMIYNCTITIGDETIVFGELLTEFLEGKTGNETSASDSGSDISVSGSDSESGSEGSDSSSAGDESASTSASGSASNVTTTSMAGSTTMSSIAAGGIAILSVALMM